MRILMTGTMSPGWYVVRVAYCAGAVGLIWFAGEQWVVFRWWWVTGSLVIIGAVSRQIWRVARSHEPRFEVTSQSVRCSFSVLSALRAVDFASVERVMVLTFRSSIALVCGPKRVLVIPWRWVRLVGQDQMELEDGGRWLSETIGVPLFRVRGPFEGLAEEELIG